MRVRTRAFVPVATIGVCGVIGPSTGPYGYRFPTVASTAPDDSAARSKAPAIGGQSVGQRW